MGKQLFWRIYLMLLMSLALVALLGAGIWRLSNERGASPMTDLGSRMLGALLPTADSSDAAQADAIARLANAVGGELSLSAADGRRIATSGEPPRRRFGESRAWTFSLPDGRQVAARIAWPHGEFIAGPLAALGGLALAVGLAAFPVVKRLTRRLERLRTGVESWGEGSLSARVSMEGRDEVAALARSFNAAAARIEALIGAHRQLLANASHELRSPLARLRVALEMQAAQPTPERAGEIARNLEEIDALIEEILLASRLDHQNDAAAREPVDLLGLAAEECARVGASVDGPIAEVDGEPRLLRRLIRNLLENAQRHGAPPIELTIGSGAPGLVRLCVQDRGPGVPEAERERVFEPFHRPSGAGETAGGWGLGLALVRQIARRHGGSVRCEGRVGGGSVFTVELPGRVG
jgi:two-component system, OmpR family, sensor kinase